jgi:predicted Zn-ribbon and HTH transcriptional regulator
MFTVIIIFIIVLTIIVLLIQAITNFAKRVGVIKDTISELRQIEEMDPTPKSVSGATDLYLRKIQLDFPDYHHSDTELAVDAFIKEYLSYTYAHGKGFQNSNVDELFAKNLERKFNNQPAYNVVINRIAIAGYHKTDTYATIDMQVSVGFHMSDKRIETKYLVKYTFMLKEDQIATKAMECENCGASLESTQLTRCPYCDAKIIRDTIMSWKFNYIKEL